MISYFILGLYCVSSIMFVNASIEEDEFYKTNFTTPWKGNLSDIAKCSVAKVKISGKTQLAEEKNISYYVWLQTTSQWIKYQGCYWGYNKNSEHLKLASNTTFPEVACLRHCNYTPFVTAVDMCQCLNHTHILKTHTCYTYNNVFPYGVGKANTCPGKVKNGTMCHCMCVYKPFPLKVTEGFGNCLSVMYTDHHSGPILQSENCESELLYITQSIVFDFKVQQEKRTWLNAIVYSQLEGGLILQHDSLKMFNSKVSNIVELGTKYWVGTFRRVKHNSFHFKIPTQLSDNCLAAEVKNGSIKNINVQICNESLPVLCRANVVDNDNTMNANDIDIINKEQAQEHFESFMRALIWIIPTVCLGIVALILLIFFICRNQHKTKPYKTRDARQQMDPQLKSDEVEMRDVHNEINIREVGLRQQSYVKNYDYVDIGCLM